MKRLLFVAAFLLAACSSDSSTTKTPHVLVIGIDGVRVDTLQQADTPTLDALIAEGTVTYDAFAGGELGAATEQPTFSGPGWSSILTGVWIDKHGVQLNVFDDANFEQYPHFFARVREKKPDTYLSSFVTWGPINEGIVSSAGADEEFWPNEPNDSAQGDIEVTAAVVAHLGAEDPDVVFVQLDEVDHQGHVAGFAPDVQQYVDALETVDAQIGEMRDAVRVRPTYASESWLILVTTDHGGIGRGHGGQTDEERTIFIVTSGGEGEPGQVVSPGPGHTAIPPTVMQHLGLEIDPAWGWESEPFGL
jgi:predicted AlkP superfamily pyrophosphatase or phosphodiesterase